MRNPKTTVAGYVGIGSALVALLSAIGALCTGQPWCLYLGAVASALSTIMNGIGNIASADGGH